MKKGICLLLLAAFLCAFVPGAHAADPPQFTTATQLPDAMQGVYFAARIKATSANALTFSFEPGDYAAHRVPGGLVLQEDGLLYGTPKESGTFSFVVQAYDKATPATATAVFTLTVRAFDQGALKTGGTDAGVMGTGMDDLTGVANAVNGGVAAMGGGLLFYVDSRGYLMESAPPFSKSERSYGAVTYANLDALNNNLYYYHHYLAERGTKGLTVEIKGRGTITIPGKKNVYITRIVEDTIARKGRVTLVLLDNAISSLSVTNELVLYLDNGMMRRADVDNGDVTTMRIYAGGREIRAASVFPYNGYAYFMGSEDRLLYRMPLDGQVAQALTQAPVTAYTAALWQGQPALFYADAQGQLYRAALDGTAPAAVEGIRATGLNADGSALYFINPDDQGRVYRMAQDTGVAEPISTQGARTILVLPGYAAYEPVNGAAIVVVPVMGGAEVQLNR